MSGESLMAEALNEQFNSVRKKGIAHCQNWVKVHYGETQKLEMSICGVLDQLNKLNPSKAQGPDDIPPSFLNTYAALLAPILHNFSIISRQ